MKPGRTVRTRPIASGRNRHAELREPVQRIEQITRVSRPPVVVVLRSIRIADDVVPRLGDGIAVRIDRRLVFILPGVVRIAEGEVGVASVAEVDDDRDGDRRTCSEGEERARVALKVEQNDVAETPVVPVRQIVRDGIPTDARVDDIECIQLGNRARCLDFVHVRQGVRVRVPDGLEPQECISRFSP